MDKLQVNVRLTHELIDAIDRKRIELQPVMGKIPNRSEVLRLALDHFLAGDMTQSVSTKSTRSRLGK
jgi:Arc/MetJ-type ribon-helix-helix transcriptional regulator